MPAHMNLRQAREFLADGVTTAASPLEPKILQGYLEAVLFAETDEDGKFWDENYSVRDFGKPSVDKAKALISKFVQEVSRRSPDLLSKYDAARIGHNLWLTKQGHGAGFWDGDYEDADEKVLLDATEKVGHEEYVTCYEDVLSIFG